jgi:methanogenic corrinoid protein MtbC1
MLSWCSYCQQFVGEVPPYDDLNVTHCICATCESNALSLTESDIAHALMLKDIQSRLFDAGRRGDMNAAKRVIDASRQANMRELDILVGIIAPMLYQIGEDWKRGAITVAEEHRFTAFCEKIIDILAVKSPSATLIDAPEERNAILLINAPGNYHTLAVRILALWLIDKGMPARAAHQALNVEGVVEIIRKVHPKFVLISMALAEQVPGVVAIVERIAELPNLVRPRIIVGGYAVKLGLVSIIPGADLLADIGALREQQK